MLGFPSHLQRHHSGRLSKTVVTKLFKYVLIAAGVGLGAGLYSRLRRKAQLKDNLDVRVTHVRIGKLSWTGEMEVRVGVTLSNPTLGRLTISHPVVHLYGCVEGACTKEVAVSEAKDRTYTIEPQRTMALEDITLRVSLRSELTNLARLPELVNRWLTTQKAGLSYKLVIKTNVPGLGLVTQERSVEL